MQPNKNIIIYIQLYWNIKVNVNSVKKKKKKQRTRDKRENKEPCRTRRSKTRLGRCHSWACRLPWRWIQLEEDSCGNPNLASDHARRRSWVPCVRVKELQKEHKRNRNRNRENPITNKRNKKKKKKKLKKEEMERERERESEVFCSFSFFFFFYVLLLLWGGRRQEAGLGHGEGSEWVKG